MSGANFLEATATANVGHSFVNIGISGFGLAFQQGRGCHQHAALAVAALGHLLFNPGLLQGTGFVRGTQGFNGFDVGACNA